MRSKKSLFNWTIILKNFLNSWPVWSLYFLILFIIGPLSMRYNRSWNISQNINYRVSRFVYHDMITAAPVIAILVSVVVMLIQFSYLQRMRTISFFHSLPVNRNKLFVSNIFSGMLVLTIPNLVIFVMTTISMSVYDCTDLSMALYWLLLITVEEFFCISLAVLCIMVTGQVVASGILYFIVMFIVSIVEFLVRSIIEIVWYGYDSVNEEILVMLKPYELMDSIGFNEKWSTMTNVVTEYEILDVGKVVTLLLIEAVLILAVSFFVYKKRKSEYAGDTIAISCLRPVFACGFGVLFGGFMARLFCEIIVVSDFTLEARICSVVFLLLFGAIGYLAARMIMDKTFRVFKKYGMRCLIFCGCMLVVSLLIVCDAFGYEKRIPDINDIQEATFVDYNYTLSTTSDKDLIQDIMTIHKTIVETGPQESLSVSRYMYIGYVLKNGAKITRRYYIDDYNPVKPVRDNVLKKHQENIIWGDIDRIKYATISTDNNNNSLLLCSEQVTREIIAAISEDIKAGRLNMDEVLNDYRGYSGTTILSVTEDGTEEIEPVEFEPSELMTMEFRGEDNIVLFVRYIKPEGTATVNAIVNGLDNNTITQEDSMKFYNKVWEEEILYNSIID